VFSWDFPGLENLERIQGLSRTFRDLQEPCDKLMNAQCTQVQQLHILRTELTEPRSEDPTVPAPADACTQHVRRSISENMLCAFNNVHSH